MYPNPFGNKHNVFPGNNFLMGKFGQPTPSQQNFGYFQNDQTPETTITPISFSPYATAMDHKFVPKQMIQSSSNESILLQQLEFLKSQVETLEHIVQQQQHLIILQKHQIEQLSLRAKESIPVQDGCKQTEPIVFIKQSQQENLQQVKMSLKSILQETNPIKQIEQLDIQINALNKLCKVFEKFCIQQDKEKIKDRTPPGDENNKQQQERNTMDHGQEEKKRRTSMEKLHRKSRKDNKTKERVQSESHERLTQNREQRSNSKTRLQNQKQNLQIRQMVKQEPEPEKQNISRLPSDAPTMLIAPEDYQHIYSMKDKHAKYLDEQFNETKITPQLQNIPNKITDKKEKRKK